MHASPAPITRRDLGDLVLLASLRQAEREGLDDAAWRRRAADLLDDGSVAAGCRDLVARCLLVSAPRSATGYRVALLGLARMERFLRSAVGSAAPAAHLAEECAVRRMLLDALAPEDQEDLAFSMCRQLVDRRDGLLVCAHAESCSLGACPFATAASVEEIDLALLWLAAAAPSTLALRARP